MSVWVIFIYDGDGKNKLLWDCEYIDYGSGSVVINKRWEFDCGVGWENKATSALVWDFSDGDNGGWRLMSSG